MVGRRLVEAGENRQDANDAKDAKGKAIGYLALFFLLLSFLCDLRVLCVLAVPLPANFWQGIDKA